MEFRVWPELILQSQGMLHIFLPLLDRGLDGVVHRLTDMEYIPVQVKGRSQLHDGKVQVAITARSLVDDRALIIAGLLTAEGLGPTLLVVDEGTFKQLAAHDVSTGIERFIADFGMHPTAITHWRPYLVPRAGLAARLLGAEPQVWSSAASDFDVGLEPQDRHDQWLGFLGESEVVRRLAENSRLDLFRPFPDLEIVELLVRDNVSRRFAGLQVKTAIPAKLNGEAHIHVQKATFVPAPSTWVVGLAWLPGLGRFAEECLVVPAEHLREIAVDGDTYLELNFHPESRKPTRMDPYRQKLSELGALIEGITANTSS